jgi:triosephosphate isomerase
MPTKIAAGNWKMNGLQIDMLELQLISKAAEQMDCRTIICPPTTLLGNATKFNKEIFIGGQDCHPEPSGAYTGDISANMLADTGASYVLVGHSERRSYHGENSTIVRAKAEAAIAATLKPVICVGENLQQRKSGDAIETVSSQIKDSVPANSEIILAYEPIWAIGTGVIPSFKEICQMHDAIRELLTKNYGSIGQKISILYGGSVKPINAAEIFSAINVNGALVGGASLKSTDFIPIMLALSKS